MFKLSAVVISLFLGLHALAQRSHQASSEELLKLQSHPQYSQPRFYLNDTPDWQPSMDVARFKYVLFSGSPLNREALFLKKSIVSNLPDGMKAVVLVTPDSLAHYQAEYAKLISADKIVFATSTLANTGTWARDAFPVPVTHKSGETTLVGANYFRNFDGNAPIANSIQFNITQFQFTFVGGNILADENGVCFIVKSARVFNTTETDLKAAYGCKEVHLMKHVNGIGDVDEVLKPIGNNTILTNTPEYVDQLKSWGYNVISLPIAKTPSYPNRTYANSLILNGTVFMPTYGVKTDADAVITYEKLGYKVIQIPSNEMSDTYQGSVHCQTMAYPAINQSDLFSNLQLQAL